LSDEDKVEGWCRLQNLETGLSGVDPSYDAVLSVSVECVYVSAMLVGDEMLADISRAPSLTEQGYLADEGFRAPLRSCLL
jgi:hypothetical protein